MKAVRVLNCFALLLPLTTLAAEARISIATQGSELSFDKKVISVKAGQPVSLTFKNAAEEGSGLRHTWVLVKPGTADQVAMEAVEAGTAKNFVPQDPNVLASTKLISPGQSETIRFKAPSQPGDYPYICTFPAHSRSLKGTLQVR